MSQRLFLFQARVTFNLSQFAGGIGDCKTIDSILYFICINWENSFDIDVGDTIRLANLAYNGTREPGSKPSRMTLIE